MDSTEESAPEQELWILEVEKHIDRIAQKINHLLHRGCVVYVSRYGPVDDERLPMIPDSAYRTVITNDRANVRIEQHSGLEVMCIPMMDGSYFEVRARALMFMGQMYPAMVTITERKICAQQPFLQNASSTVYYVGIELTVFTK